MKKITDFTTKKEFFSYLIKNKKEIIEFKKVAIKFTDPFGAMEKEALAIKSLNTNYKDDVASGAIMRTVICNTYNWMDSHDDVHIDGCFAKSIADRQDKIYHLHDHQHMVTGKVGRPKSIYEKSIDWKDLGVEMDGKTMALFMDSSIVKEWNPIVFGMYLSKDINQHSVGMIYMTIDLALNDAEEKEEYAQWNKYINTIGNKDKVMLQGYFWAVREAKLIENSCVLAGSNELTPTIDNEKTKQDPETKSETPTPGFFSMFGKALSE